ncbi:MAG: tetratricopeptide repeat protein [Acidobacteriota bacterium]
MNSVHRRAKLLTVGMVLLLINSAYLATYAEATVFYLTNVLAHLGLGLLMLLILIAAFGQRLKRLEWNDTWWLLMLSSGIIGTVLLLLGNTRNTRWLLYSHIILMVLALLLMCVRAQDWLQLPRRAALLLVAAVLLLPSTARIYQYYSAPSPRITNPDEIPVLMEEEGDGPNSPFFPSSATTNTRGLIPSNFFMTSQMCARCHAEIYQQWNASVHHFSSFNNQWYRKSIEYMQDVAGLQASKWCAGCHDHAVFFNGRFERPIKEQINTPEAQAGLGCTSCHSIVHVRSTMGQGDFEVEYPPLHDWATSSNRLLSFTHDLLIKADSEPHRKTFMKPFHRGSTAEFCSSCHKVHLDKPVNNYRWFRGFNEYDNWQASGVSGQGARSFYSPAQPQKCVDCHMPLVAANDPAAVNGKVHSHRFPGANTAIPYVNGDQQQLKVVTDFLQDQQISVDIFAMSKGEPAKQLKSLSSREEPRLASTFAVGEETLDSGVEAVITPPEDVFAPLNKVNAEVRRGDSLRIDLVVRTRKVGHFFPGGTVDAFDVWVELQAVDNRGEILFWSGMVEDKGHGPVETGAHFYRALLLDEHGNRINKRNAWAARSVAYVRLIPPGAADTVRYRLNIPKDCGDEITLKAKVHYRKFSWWNTQWAYAGVPEPSQTAASVTKDHDDRHFIFNGDTSNVSGKLKAIPELPIVTMAQDEVKLKVLSAQAPLPQPREYLDKSVRERWNDYGIGLLLQGDIKAAEAAFLKVTQMEPAYADGWVNVARARIQEGRLDAAQEMLTQALKIKPELAKAQFFMAMVLKGQGQYDQALTYLNSATQQFPRDRVVLNQLGRILLLQRQYEQAIKVLKRVLEIDPEDLSAHYNLMLSYQGSGNQEMAQRERRLYMRFKADESSQAITGDFRKLNPEDNNERQSIHEHVSISAEKIRANQNVLSAHSK